jgi:hypothetical protein
VVEDKPAGGPHEGIKVHGHWTIDVRNPDGTLASHRDFENSLIGPVVLSTSLARTAVTGLWSLTLFAVSTASNPCGSVSSTYCSIVEPTETVLGSIMNLNVSAPTSGPNVGKLVLSGSVIAAQAGTFIAVETFVDYCPVGVAPAACTASCSGCTTAGFTTYTFNPAINITAGQLVQVTVVFSFM